MLWHQKADHNYAIELHIENDYIVFNNRRFDFNDLKIRPEFRPFTRWIFYAYRQTNAVTTDRFGVEWPIPIPVEQPVEIFSITNISKAVPGNIPIPFMYGHTLVSFVVYPESTGFKDSLCIATRSNNDSVPFNVTTKNNSDETVGYSADRVFSGDMPKNEFLPKCRLTKTKDNDKYNMRFTYKTVSNTASNSSFIATVKTNKGYVSHQKVEVENGTGEFVFIPLGLSNGEIAKVQVGIGKFTDVVSAEITC
jgi:hypothetical protein